MSEPTTRPQVLYRFYGTAGDLLYIGISVHAPSRFMQHRDDKPWWAQIAEIRLEHFPDRDSVCAAERAAIQTEHPRYNVVHARGGIVTDEPQMAPATPETLFRPGQVVALDVVGARFPPVGEVLECTLSTVELGLYSWLTGYFTADTRTVWIGDIRGFRLAMPMTDDDKRQAWLEHERGIVWDMDPLADFQNEHRTPDELP